MFNPLREFELMQTRRQLFGKTALGVGTAALSGLMNNLQAAPARSSNTEPKAKRVIYLFMSGGPSHLDLWDYKPNLKDKFNEQLPSHVRDCLLYTSPSPRDS